MWRLESAKYLKIGQCCFLSILGIKYNMMIKTLLFSFFILSLPSFAKVDEKEMQSFLEAIKEKKDEELLIASEQFKDCESQFTEFREDSSKKSEFEKCLNSKIIGDKTAVDADAKLLEIAKNLGLSSFNKKASETSDSILEYLQKRIRKTIYGEEDKKAALSKLKNLNYVDHDVYYQLYSEQIGKNTLLQVSRYCLENFGHKDPTHFIGVSDIYDQTGKAMEDGKGNSFKTLAIGSVVEKKSDIAKDKSEDDMTFSDLYQLPDLLKQNPKEYFDHNLSTKMSYADFWKDHDNIKEFEVCTLSTPGECKKKYKDQYRSVHVLSLMKDAEFILSSKDSDNKLIKDRYNFCAGQVIKNMCELYKCNNVYDAGTPDKEKSRCENLFGISKDDVKKKEHKTFFDNDETKRIDSFQTLSKSDGKERSEKEQKGAIACNLVKRLEEYRIILNGVKEVKDEFNSLTLSDGTTLKRTKFQGGATNFGFKGNFDVNKVNKALTISSAELSSGVKSLTEASDKAKKLREKCMEEEDGGRLVLRAEAHQDEECGLLLAKLDESKFGTIELDTEAKTTAKLQEIEKLESKEDLEKFLKDNEMGHYVDRLKELDDPKKLEEIKNLISQDFKAKRLALVDRLKEKFDKERKLKVGGDSSDQKLEDEKVEIENDIANQTIADIETHKQRVETLFQYANIASSFLELKERGENGEAKIVGSNTSGRLKELGDLKNQDDSSIQKYFTSLDESSESGEGKIDYSNVINEFINFKEESSETKSN